MRVVRVDLVLQPYWTRLRVLHGLDGLLHVAEQHPERETAGGSLQLWYFTTDLTHDPKLPEVELRVFPTDVHIPNGARHVGTVVAWRGRHEWHVFARDYIPDPVVRTNLRVKELREEIPSGSRE